MKYSIIIPCYNEAENIHGLISRIVPLQDRYDLEYILVENGSKDSSKKIFKEHVEEKYKDLKVVYVDINRGYGYGLQQGMKVAEGDYVGWIHADLQMPPEELIKFFDEIDNYDSSERLFLKGIRTNRSVFDRFFTNGQSIFNSCLFGAKIYDVGAIPVLFDRRLLEKVMIEDMPNDFSIEIYVYKEAIRYRYTIIRLKVALLDRVRGDSSWNHGLASKLKQSKRIFEDSIKIKRGEKVL